MVDKIKHYMVKNLKSIFKFIWGVVLLGAGIYYIYHNYTRILVFSNTIDNIIIVGTLILAFFPIISEISLMGFSVKKEIQKTKQEMKEGLVDLKLQMIDIKTTTTQNTTQNVKFEFLPSKDEMKNSLKETDETKVENKSEQNKIEIEIESDVSDDTVYLFKVRLMLDKYLNKICDSNDYTYVIPLMKRIDMLNRKNLITSDTYQYLRQVLNICNRGIHGEIISDEYINFVKGIIPRMYSQLNEVTKRMEFKNIMTCPRCKFTGYSEYENVCPKCGFVSDDD